jgi:hypothetical protein
LISRLCHAWRSDDSHGRAHDWLLRSPIDNSTADRAGLLRGSNDRRESD